MTTPPSTLPRTTPPDTGNRLLAHFYCIVEHEKGNHVGLCGTPTYTVPRGDEHVCVVCVDLVVEHRKGCKPCFDQWGMPRL